MRARWLLIAALSTLSGCCGGYSVVRTTYRERAEVREGGELSTGGASVLHFSRLGEPPNACGSGAKYTEDLWIQIPSAKPGGAYTIGAPGVVALYRRDQDGDPVRAKGVAGTVRVKEQTKDGLSVRLDVQVVLPSGESVKLDDDYAFHPKSPSE